MSVKRIVPSWLAGFLTLVAAQPERIAFAQAAPPAVEIDAAIPAELFDAVEEALQQAERPAGLSALILDAEEYPERVLAERGDARKLLAAAGVDDVAKDELAGLVIDAQGRPVAGAAIDAWSWFPGHETTTDDKGVFRLKGLDPRSGTQVVVSKPGYSPRMFPKRPAGRNDWVVILRNETYFEGVVVGKDGKAAANATVRAVCGPFELDGGVMNEYSLETVSAADGTFRLDVFSNLYEIQASAPGRGVRRQSKVAIAPDRRVELAIQLEEGVRFEARVVDSATGDPVDGFRLFKWLPPRISGRSDETGKIVFDDLIPGPIDLQCGGGDKLPQNREFDVFGPGPFGRWWSSDAVHEHQQFQLDNPGKRWQRNFDDLSFRLDLGMKPVTIVVERGVAITGQVTDPEGKPVAGATVAPALTGTGNSLTGDTRYSVRTDADGNYRMLLPASNKAVYNLVAHDGGYEEWRRWANGVTEPFRTEPGQTLDDVDLKLTVPAVIRGRVTSNGKPVADRQVRAHDFRKLENRYYDPTVRTAADGTFELKFVRPGKHFIQAHPFWIDAEDAKQGSTIVEIDAGEVLRDVELQVDGK